MNHGNNFYHRSYDSEQHQHQATAAESAQVHAVIYKDLLVRRAAAYGITIIDQVMVLCCEAVHDVYVTNNSDTTQQQHYVCIYN